MSFEERIKEKALQLGFNDVGIASAEKLPDISIQRFKSWLSAEYAADMDYLKRNQDKRFYAENLLKNAKSVICTATSYAPIPPAKEADCLISSYACYEDYHKHIKNKLFELAEFISVQSKEKVKFKVCVDSVPIQERSYALLAGIGFIGKNRMLINPKLGSRLFLGEIITTAPLKPDRPITADCGSCNKCVESCPTGAISNDGLDSRKCINYLTIESSNPIPDEFKQLASKYVYGCEICLNACPYNQKATPKVSIAQVIKSGYKTAEILNMTEDDFLKHFGKTPIKRTGLDRLKTNAKMRFEKA